MIVYILAALLVFGVLIAVHELGHFLAAKACGVRVNEFSIGMGPALWKKQKGDTQYSLRAFPVGGFCAMEGEEEDSDDPAALNRQGFWKKLLIFAAGAAMNFLTGLIIIFFLYADAQAFYTPTITGFAEGCPLESADGLQTGDRILSIDGERVYVYSDLSLLLPRNTTGVYDLVVERGGEKVRLNDFAMERRTYTGADGKEFTGLGLYFGVEKADWGVRLRYTWNNAVDFVRLVRLSLQMLVTGEAGLKDLSGPVGSGGEHRLYRRAYRREPGGDEPAAPAGTGWRAYLLPGGQRHRHAAVPQADTGQIRKLHPLRRIDPAAGPYGRADVQRCVEAHQVEGEGYS